MVLEVKISEPVKRAPERILTFSQSPIRIGRNQLNDVHLDDPFVSDWHGIIRFDAAQVAYFDLGSTNGTMMAGKRVTKNVPVPLTEASRISLGRIDLTVSHRRSESGPHRTIGWGQPIPAVGGVAAPLRAPAANAPGGDPRANTGSPRANTADPRANTGDPRANTGDPRAISGLPVGPFPAQAAAHDAQATERLEKIVQAFAEAFVGLKNGYEQFGSEVGVRTINGMTPLHKARTGRDVLDYLQSPGVDSTAALHDLISIFADFGIHHIAMMEGVTEGIRAVLQSLDPRANGLDSSPGILSKGRYRELWKAYLERFEQVVSDDNELHAGIFGDDFARAYASVTTGDKGGGTSGNSR